MKRTDDGHFSIRLSANMGREVRAISAMNGSKVSDVLRELLRLGLRKARSMDVYSRSEHIWYMPGDDHEPA